MKFAFSTNKANRVYISMICIAKKGTTIAFENLNRLNILTCQFQNILLIILNSHTTKTGNLYKWPPGISIVGHHAALLFQTASLIDRYPSPPIGPRENYMLLLCSCLTKGGIQKAGKGGTCTHSWLQPRVCREF